MPARALPRALAAAIGASVMTIVSVVPALASPASPAASFATTTPTASVASVGPVGSTPAAADVDALVHGMYGPPYRSDGRSKNGVKIGAAPWGAHEALPVDLPTNLDFYHGARPGNFGPAGSGVATTGWGQIFEAEPGTGTFDARAQVRDLRIFFLLGDGRWVERRPDVDDHMIEGGYFNETFRSQRSAGVRDETHNGGGSSASLRDLAAANHVSIHFWFKGWYPREVIPADAVGMAVAAEMRLIPDGDPHVDLRRARFIGSIGADNYPSATHLSNGVPITAVMQPRMMFLTPEWRTFSGTSLTEAQLRANPPPISTVGSSGPVGGTTAAGAVAGAAAEDATGLWVGYSDGAVQRVGRAADHGHVAGMRLNAPIVAMARTPGGNGYWLLGRDGGVFSFGGAAFHGSTGHLRLNQPVVSLASHPRGGGYWFVAGDGGVFSFGLPFHGSAGNLRLNEPVVGMAATATGNGYWLVASDGGVFAYGDAPFSGSTGDLRLSRPIVAMAADPDGRGYWFVAADGGVFAFDAAFHGSAVGHLAPGDRVVNMVAHPAGGYWLITARGGVLAFGAAGGVARPAA